MDVGFDWSREKNQQLIAERGVSFERVVYTIEHEGPIDVVEHPNQKRYAGQFVYVLDIDDYAYLIPFVVQTDGTHFLKTIIPSRKATRDYRRGRPT